MRKRKKSLKQDNGGGGDGKLGSEMGGGMKPRILPFSEQNVNSEYMFHI